MFIATNIPNSGTMRMGSLRQSEVRETTQQTHICSPQVSLTNRTKESDRKRINNGPRVRRYVDTNKLTILCLHRSQ